MAELIAAAPGASSPLVSVIIPTYNSRDYLAETLDAIAAQTLSPEALQVLVVDDGSNDGTWDYLTAVAAERKNVQIFRQPHSGRASTGRNRGLREAVGRYVFFNDADDYLGSDALRRLVETAERERSDVVIGHVHRIGLPTNHRPGNRTVLDADLVTDGAWRSLSPHKLVRRSLIERLDLTFPEDMVFGEDQVFMATCLFAAGKISMLGDYDFYYRRSREDRGNLSANVMQTLTNKKLTSCRMTQLVLAHTEPGRRRDALLRRVLLGTLAGALHVIFARASKAERADFLAAVRREALPHLSRRLLRIAAPAARLRLLTATVGTADQLLMLNKVLARGWRYRVDDGVLCYDLGSDLNALLDARQRRATESFALEHRLVRISPVRSGLELQVDLRPTRLPVESVCLEAHTRGTGWVEVGTAAPTSDGQVTFSVEPGDIWPAGDRTDGDKRWDLRLQARGGGIVLAQSVLGWPSSGDKLPAASRSLTVAGPGVGQEMRAKLYPDESGSVRLWIRREHSARPSVSGLLDRARVRLDRLHRNRRAVRS